MPTKDATPPHHSRQPDRPTTTSVIHSYEENETVLGRWFRHALEKGPRFWALLAGVVVVTIALVVVFNSIWTGKDTTSEAWLKLTEAKTPDQQVQVANEFPQSSAAGWALLEAASGIYNEASELQATNRDAASPLMKRAYTLYQEVYNKAAKTDADLARLAAFGMARTLEASNDLAGAGKQYQFVASTWPNTPEGKQADRLARALGKKQNVEFYNWLATYKPPEVSLPPLGSGKFELPPGLDLGPGKLDLPPALDFGTGGMAPPAGVPAGSVPATPPASSGTSELPKNVFEPSSAPASDTRPPAAKSEAPRP